MGNLAQRVALSSFFCGGVPYPPVSRLDFLHSAIGYLVKLHAKKYACIARLSFVFDGTISTDHAVH